MLVLGLGSNEGDRLSHLREAYLAIKNTPGITIHQVSPIYISDALLPDNAPASWDKPYLNLALRCESTLDPHALLKIVKQIEQDIGRAPKPERFSPRPIDIDILAWGDETLHSETLNLPHKSLLDRPFALWPLADVAPFWYYQNKTAEAWAETFGSRFSGEAPFRTRQIQHRIDTPQLVGAINVTPDSVTLGNQALHPNQAVTFAASLVNAGASILDIGAESTSFVAEPISHEEEWNRLQPVLEGILERKNSFLIPPKISIDTRHPETAEKVLALGVDWINDVTGLDDPRMRSILKAADVDCVIMHHLSIPERRSNVLPRHESVIQSVLNWGKLRLDELEAFGIPRSRMIFDPGVGFGKMAEQSYEVIKQCEAFTTLNTRLLIGHSRKSFLTLQTNLPPNERDLETAMISAKLAKLPVDYIRVHNVAYSARAIKVASAF